ncbi:alpha/beta fold hydrolase [Muricoccus radiodurans]|uniref:alpha/beta fold hydrolase n=1 Tax=Muricoccus radiodurans TaxID=2231721 RepID=UPI003CEF3C71
MNPPIRHLVPTRFGQIHLREAGRGPAIALMHINQQSSALYLELMAELAPAHRVVAIDYPSHGMSDPIAFQPSIGDYAEVVVAVMQALGISRFTALGEATGAAVAIELGVSHADRIEAVVLLNCPYYRDRKQAHDVHAPLKNDLRPADASGFPMTRTLDFMRERDPSHAPLNPDQSWMDRINRAQIEAGRNRWQALDALNAYDIGAGMERLQRDTLLLMGEHFHYTGLMDEYRRRLPRLVAGEVVKEARFCMGWEKASEVGARVRAFLADRGREAAA